MKNGLFNVPTLKVLDDCDGEALFRAVVATYAEYAKEGKQPGAEKWTSDTRRYRSSMVHDVINEWSVSSGKDDHFPFHDDFVARVWFAFRKATETEKENIYEAFCIEPPRRQ